MYVSSHHLNEIGQGGSTSSLPIIEVTEPTPPPNTLVVFVIILIFLRGGDVNNSKNPLPQLSHDFPQRLMPGEAKRYKTRKEKPLEITSAPIIVVFVVNAVISDRLGEKR